MGNTRRLTLIGAAIAALTLGIGCGGGQGPSAPSCTPAAPMTAAGGKVTVTNDSCSLEQAVDRTLRDVPIQPPSQASSSPLPYRAAPAAPAATLTLVATISPPVVNGQTVQAAGVTIKGDFAIVSYMTKGDPYGGALDVVQTTNGERPKLVSRATFSDADVIAADFDESQVFYVGATGDPALDAPAFLGAIKLTGGQLDLTELARTGLLSYAGTSVAVVDGQGIYTASGSDGAFAAFAYGSGAFSKTLEYRMHDARAVFEDGTRIAVVGGTPGTLAVFPVGASSPHGTYPFAGADLPEAKSGVELSGGKAFIAAGTAGVQVLSAATGKLLGQLPRPSVPGLDPSVVTTNAVSVDGDLLFVCDGEAGVYVAQGDQRFAQSGSEDPQALTLLGQLQLGPALSANHVAYRGKFLMVAAGLGGLMIVRVDTKP